MRMGWLRIAIALIVVTAAAVSGACARGTGSGEGSTAPGERVVPGNAVEGTWNPGKAAEPAAPRGSADTSVDASGGHPANSDDTTRIEPPFPNYSFRGQQEGDSGLPREGNLVSPRPSPAPWSRPRFELRLAPYTILPDLSNVENLRQFGSFSEEQKKLLAQNGFFVAPGDREQPFFIYENNDYLGIPNFVTTDSVLHTYHLLYDYLLRQMEHEQLFPRLGDLTLRLLDESRAEYERARGPLVKEAALANTAYFAVAAGLLGKEVQVPDDCREQVQAELAAIEAHAERARSVIFPYQIDYTQFVPRGHYTRTEDLKKYFKAMMWYGLAPFPLEYEGEGAQPVRADRQIRQALLITYSLGDPGDQRGLWSSWQDVYTPTAVLVGKADDFTPGDYRKVAGEALGKGWGASDLEREDAITAFYAAAKKLPGPRIRQKLVGIPAGPQFRFMGQRYIPDSELLQELSHWPKRPFPRGLDVPAVLGSARARDLLLNEYREGEKWAEYPSKLATLRSQFEKLDLTAWQSNLYYGWLWSLKPVLEERGEGYPIFMRNQAWRDKNLNSFLGSWAELRHDTVLYGKQSGAECGGGEELPPPPPSFVEPEVEFYTRLAWLVDSTRAHISGLGMLTEGMDYKLDYFARLVRFLERISLKELTGESVTREEYDQLKIYGTILERLSIRVAVNGIKGWYEITSEADRDMAVVTDVHTSGGSVLEEGAGHADEIYVVVPAGGKLYLARGAVFSYYEFVHPASSRLTDEDWQKMLKQGSAPERPVWTRSYLRGRKSELPPPTRVYSSGC